MSNCACRTRGGYPVCLLASGQSSNNRQDDVMGGDRHQSRSSAAYPVETMMIARYLTIKKIKT